MSVDWSNNMKRIFSVIMIVTLIIVFFIGKIIFYEPDNNRSKYDKAFVTKKNCIYFNAECIEEAQEKILSYANEWEELEGLISIKVYLNQSLEVTRLTYCFLIPQISDYYGYLEVICEKEEEQYVIWSAENHYNTIVNPKVYTVDVKDVLLQEKIDKSIDYITTISQTYLETYIVMINGEELSIDAHNISVKSSEDKWEAVIKY